MPESTSNVLMRTLHLGVASGLFTCVAYPLLSFAPLPDMLAVTLAALIGPALGTASYGLQRFIDVDEERLSSRSGTMMNSLAGALLTAMLLVQIAVRDTVAGGELSAHIVAVWLGLDVAWDAYVGLGTVFFSIAMLRHPRLGRAFGVPGLVIGVALLVLNFSTFPTPPAEAGSVDLGPLVGLWYLFVTLRIWGSLRWARGLVQQ